MPENPENPAAPSPQEQSLAIPRFDLGQLLPHAELEGVSELTLARAEIMQNALIILGPTAGTITVCPGNQLNVDNPESRCALWNKCDFVKAGEAPEGELCPLERNLVLARFQQWCTDFGVTPTTLGSAERASISELVNLDLQETRCSAIISQAGHSARMTQVNIKEVHPETGDPMSWERVLHANVVLLDSIHTKRRMILKDWELTPEAKTRKARLEGKNKGTDISSQQSKRADQLRQLKKASEVTPTFPTTANG